MRWWRRSQAGCGAPSRPWRHDGRAAAGGGRAPNPLFNANRLKLGIFGTNGKGAAQTLVPEAYRPTWQASVQTAQLADDAGFEAILAYARWKGYVAGQPAHPSGVTLDPFTWCAAIAQATRQVAVIPTVHAPVLHPIVAAKQCATIDIISGGRLALNVVGGWNGPELAMFGAPMAEHDARYDHLQEWLEIVQQLWRQEEEFDHAGRFFNVKLGSSMPKPLQRPGPPIVNAGGSDRGQSFACEFADVCFLILRSEDAADIAAQIASYKQMAQERSAAKSRSGPTPFVSSATRGRKRRATSTTSPSRTRTGRAWTPGAPASDRRRRSCRPPRRFALSGSASRPGQAGPPWSAPRLTSQPGWRSSRMRDSMVSC